MTQYAALDVSQDATAICLVDEHGAVLRQAKVMTCPETIAQWLAKNATGLVRVGMETGPLAVWLWNELHAKSLPVVCMDARHANAALKMQANKTDRNDATGLAQIVRTGWFKQVGIKTRTCYEVRSLLAAREVLVRVRVKLENEIRGLLRTFGVLFGKAAGGFAHRAHEIIAGELDASPPMQIVIETLMQARVAILDRIKVLDRQVLAIARANATARLFMSAPGIGAITALSVASAFDDARPSSAMELAYLGGLFGLDHDENVADLIIQRGLRWLRESPL